MEHVIRIPHKCHNFEAEFVTLVSVKVPSGYLKSCLDRLSPLLPHQIESAHDRSLSDSYVADVYDELLSQGEIQGHLNKVNLLVALEDVSEAARSGDKQRLLRALQHGAVGIQCVVKPGKVALPLLS